MGEAPVRASSICTRGELRRVPRARLATISAALVHKGILFDEASCKMVLSQKKPFQCPNTDVQLGCSTTNCHSYSVYVSGIAMIIATNCWQSQLGDLQREEDREWLNANSWVEKVTTPLYVPLEH